MDRETWDEIYDQFSGIENTALRNRETFPQNQQAAVQASVTRTNNRMNGRTGSQNRYSRTPTMTQFPGRDLRPGAQDPISQEVVR